jgi:hypothetical protein
MIMELVMQLSCKVRMLISFGTGTILGFFAGVFGMGLVWAAGLKTPTHPPKNERTIN